MSGPDREPGIGGTSVNTTAVHDDGTGPSLYVGGQFVIAQEGKPAIRSLACWSGESWSLVGEAVPTSTVRALASFDDGSGPALYAGAFFTDVPLDQRYLRRWSGSAWTGVGTGVASGSSGAGSIQLLRVLVIAGQAALYVGGTDLTVVGGTTSSDVLKWDGQLWSQLGTNFSGSCYALENYNGSLFQGNSSNGLFRWDGTTWNQVPQVPDSGILALAVFDDGGGACLYIGGYLSGGGGCGRFNGVTYEPLAMPNASSVGSFLVVNGASPVLHAGVTGAGATSIPSIRTWTGSAWSVLAAATPVTGGTVEIVTMAPWPAATPGAFVAGGRFRSVGGVPSRNIAQYSGSQWVPFPAAAPPSVSALARWDDGTGEALYIGGVFEHAGGAPALNIVRRDGTGFAPLGEGLAGRPTEMVVHDDGGGSALFVGGRVTASGTTTLNGIGKWTGTQWAALGTGVSAFGSAGGVNALIVDDTGPTPYLVAGGEFAQAGGIAASAIARWTGSSWVPIGSGVASQFGSPVVSTLAVHDDGSGRALYVGGSFVTAGGQAAPGIAKVVGSTWFPVGPALSGTFGAGSVRAMSSFVESGQSGLFIVGPFNAIGGVPMPVFSRWDGQAWSRLGPSYTYSLSDPGIEAMVGLSHAGPTLYTASWLTLSLSYAGQQHTGLVAWDGQGWAGLNPGGGVRTLLPVDDPADPRLIVGGDFVEPGGIESPGLAVWHACPGVRMCYADCNQDGALTVADFGCFQTFFVLQDRYADCTLDSAMTVADFGCYQTKFVLGCP